MPTTPVQAQGFTDPAGYGARLLAFDQFDPALGVLGGIRLGLTASVDGSLSIESLEAASYTVGYTAAAFVSVFAPDSTLLAQLVSPAYGAATLAAFDGTVDFAGPSGITLATTASASSATTFSGGGSIDSAPFIGTGIVALPVGDYALNSIAGPANMRVLASAAAAGTVTLAYDYTPESPGGGGTTGSGTTTTNPPGVLGPSPVTATTLPQIFRFADQTTGWQSQLAVAQFDPTLGTLSAIQFRLVSDLSATAAVENHGAAPAAISVNQAVTTSLTLTGAPLATATLRANRSIAVGAADGSDDFAGSGGASDGGRTATATIGATIGATAQLASFTGTGTVDVSIAALGTGDIQGPASFLADIAARSGAVVEIAYTYLVDLAASAVAITDTTAATSSMAPGDAYAGPVATLQHQFISITSDNLAIAATTDNWFIRGGSGDDAIAVQGGTNVIDGGGGSNFLTGGFGQDTFFVDARGASADIWSTVANFHSGDAATIWGITQADFTLDWTDGQGAASATGLTLHATAAGLPTASLTLAGYTTAELTNGALSVSFGNSGGDNYLYIHAN